MYGNWIIVNGSAIGESHKENNTPCQDAGGVIYDGEENFGVAIVSDGAGSKENSQYGSSFLVESGLEYFQTMVNNSGFSVLLKSEEEDLKTLFIKAFSDLRTQLETYSTEQELPFNSLGATMIVVLFSEDGIICGHVGDGRAGYQLKDESWHSILTPSKGREVNHTVFLTTEAVQLHPEDFIRVQRVERPIKSFTLLSDGAESACYLLNEYNEELDKYEARNLPYAKFFNPNIEVLKALFESGKSPEELNELWTQYLHNGNATLEHEIDDKTLIVGTLKP